MSEVEEVFVFHMVTNVRFSLKLCQMNFFFFAGGGKPIVITKTTEVVVGLWQVNQTSRTAG